MSEHQEENYENYDPITWVPKQHSHGTKILWKVFWVLTIITFVDVAIYFTPVSILPQMIKNGAFIILGLVKAFYIVGTFMHLNQENKMLIYILTITPIVFILYLIALILYEGNYYASFNY